MGHFSQRLPAGAHCVRAASQPRTTSEMSGDLVAARKTKAGNERSRLRLFKRVNINNINSQLYDVLSRFSSSLPRSLLFSELFSAVGEQFSQTVVESNMS